MTPELKFLKECSGGELVRVKTGDGSQWAIVGKPDRRYQPIVLLSTTIPPMAVDMLEGGAVAGDFERYSALSFGTKYSILPQYQGSCQLGAGSLFTKAGSFIFADKEQYLLTSRERSTSIMWFDFRTGGMSSRQGGQRAAFAGWELRVEGLSLTAPPLLSHKINVTES
jgi:hypothetical protein